MPLDSLQDLLVEELQDLLDAELQIVEALGGLARAASATELTEAFRWHRSESKGHVRRLRDILGMLGGATTPQACQAMRGLVGSATALAGRAGSPEVIDAGLIAAAQRVEHYEIATYTSVRTWAQELARMDVADLLQETLDEESKANHRLADIAEAVVVSPDGRSLASANAPVPTPGGAEPAYLHSEDRRGRI